MPFLRSGYFIAILGLSFGLMGCNAQVESYVKTSLKTGKTVAPTPTPTPSNILYTVGFTYPSATKIAGWKIRLEGTCSGNGISVALRDANNLVSSSVSCAGNVWKTYLDISALAVGAQQIYAKQTDAQGMTSLEATLQITKDNSSCDLPANRAKNYAAGLAGGAGTVVSPYLICTPKQLAATSGSPSSKSFSLQNDLDFDDGDTNGDGAVNGTDTDYVSGLGWTSISLPGNGFSVFYGNSFEIRGLTVNNTGADAALFSDGTHRIFKNLSVLNSSITGSYASGFVSHCDVCVLIDIHTSGTITTPSGFGDASGMVGSANTFILRSSFEGTVSGGGMTGGLIAEDNNGFIVVVDSYVRGTITSTGGGVGGLGGSIVAYPGLFANSYMTGTVSGNNGVGGITGYYGTIVNCFSDATISHVGVADSYHGGLNGYGGEIYNSFYSGNLAAGVGNSYGVISGSLMTGINNYYWSGGTCTGSGGACQYSGTPRASLASFKDTAQAPMNVWDITGSGADGYDDHWAANASGYPQVWWEQSRSFTVPFAGAGTTASPYLISTAAELSQIGGNTRWMDGNFKLANSIDMSAIVNYVPIGFNAGLIGAFDGNGFTVSNVTYSSATTDNVGFFANKLFGSITNLTLSNINITGRKYVAALVGSLETATVTNARVISGSVSATGARFAGGLIARAVSPTITKSSSAASVTAASASDVGGLVGQMDGGSVATSSASGDVVGTSRTGGLLGWTSWVQVDDSYATGNVTGTTQVGGLIGNHSMWKISRSYSTGNVTGTTQVGGLVGYKSADAGNTLVNSFTVSAVNGNSATNDVGPIVGVITDATGSTGDYTAAAGMTCTNAGVGGVNALIKSTQATAAAFKDPTNAPLTAWDFATIWLSNFPGGYPTLR